MSSMFSDMQAIKHRFADDRLGAHVRQDQRLTYAHRQGIAEGLTELFDSHASETPRASDDGQKVVSGEAILRYITKTDPPRFIKAYGFGGTIPRKYERFDFSIASFVLHPSQLQRIPVGESITANDYTFTRTSDPEGPALFVDIGPSAAQGNSSPWLFQKLVHKIQKVHLTTILRFEVGHATFQSANIFVWVSGIPAPRPMLAATQRAEIADVLTSALGCTPRVLDLGVVAQKPFETHNNQQSHFVFGAGWKPFVKSSPLGGTDLSRCRGVILEPGQLPLHTPVEARDYRITRMSEPLPGCSGDQVLPHCGRLSVASVVKLHIEKVTGTGHPPLDTEVLLWVRPPEGETQTQRSLGSEYHATRRTGNLTWRIWKWMKY